MPAPTAAAPATSCDIAAAPTMPISPAVDADNGGTIGIARIGPVAVISSSIGAIAVIRTITIIRLIAASVGTIAIRLVNGAALGQQRQP